MIIIMNVKEQNFVLSDYSFIVVNRFMLFFILEELSIHNMLQDFLKKRDKKSDLLYDCLFGSESFKMMLKKNIQILFKRNFHQKFFIRNIFRRVKFL